MTQTLTRTFLQNKLGRDKLVEIMAKRGSLVTWRHLNDQEFDDQLRIKLAEETEEVAKACSRDELIAELADVFEVIDSLAKFHGISQQEIIKTQTQKRHEKGGFEGRKFFQTAQHPVGSPAEHYCLADPTKYPEVVSE